MYYNIVILNKCRLNNNWYLKRALGTAHSQSKLNNYKCKYLFKYIFSIASLLINLQID